VLTVVTSGKAAPGVTTTVWALALSWPCPVVVADCDPAGGDMTPGLLAGRVSVDRGLLSWSSAARRGIPTADAASMFAEHAVEVPEAPDAWLIPGFSNATQGNSFTEATWRRLADALQASTATLGRDALVDTGRMIGNSSGNSPILAAADRVLIAVRPSVRSVHGAQEALTLVREKLGDLTRVSALVIGDGPYSAAEVAGALQVPFAGTLPEDRDAAAALSDGASLPARRPLQRFPLLKAAAALARKLATDGATDGAIGPDVHSAVGVGA
jgi:septum formation inhibitor-activating ATPase MinD